MSNILNLNTKDENINNIIAGNPFYIDIKGSVNICLIRCGQEIESCNSVNFSTMTNYGKILTLNKSKNNDDIKCNIKLAFDTSNDNKNDGGSSSYNFESVFFTVPSLHKLNGVIYDMETFIIFSSTQKNGNILYVCLCTFSNGVNSVKQNDWKLLNYKLMNELFTQKNTIPDMYGTNEINGIPNPVDLNNFIPKKGFRNFYDYTHPLNTNVNFRVFQNTLSISNGVLDVLKTKLTPGNIFTNFKSAISQTINPVEGLFFYFSEDLTDRYQSLSANASNEENDKICVKYSSSEEDDVDVKEKFEKLNISDNIILEENQEEDDFDEKKKETFESINNSLKNQSIIFIAFMISFILISNITYSYFINNFFKSNNGISEDEMINYLNELNYDNMKQIIGTKFKLYLNLSIQSILTLLSIILLVSCIPLNNLNIDINNISIIVFIFIVIILINSSITFILNLRYFFYRFRSIYDDDFSQKEIFLYNFLKDKIYKNNISDTFKKIYKIIFKEDFTDFLVQTGGADKFPLAPGPNNYENSKLAEHKDELDKFKSFNLKSFIEIISTNAMKEKFTLNNKYMSNTKYLLLLISLFYFIGSLIQLKFVQLTDNSSIRFFITFVASFSIYVPIFYSFIVIANNFIYLYLKIPNTTKTINILFLILGLGGFILSLFSISISQNKSSSIVNYGFWLVFSIIIIFIIGLLSIKSISAIINKFTKKGGTTNSNPLTDKERKIIQLKQELDHEKEKRKLYESEIERLKSLESPEDLAKRILILKELYFSEVEKRKRMTYDSSGIPIGSGSSSGHTGTPVGRRMNDPEEIKKEINKLENTLKELTNNSQSKNNEIEQLKELIKFKDNEINDLKERIRNCDEEILIINNQMNELRNNLINITQLSQDQVNQLNLQLQQLNTRKDEIKRDRDDYINRVDILINEIETKNIEINQLRSNSQLKNNEINQLRSNSQLKNNEINQLRSEMGGMINNSLLKNNEINILRTNSQLKNNEINRLENEIIQRNNEINDLKLNLDDCYEEVIRLNGLINQLEDRLLNSQNLSGNEINRFNDEINELKTQRIETERDINEYIDRINILINEIESKNQQIESLTFKSRFKNNEIQRLRDNSLIKNQQILNLTSTSQLKNNELRRFRDNSLLKNEQIQDLTFNSLLKNNEIEQLREDMISKNNEINNLIKKLNDCDENLLILNEEINELRNRLLDLSELTENEIEDLNNQIYQLTNEREELLRNKNIYEEDIYNLNNQILQKNQKIESLINTSQLKNNEIERLSSISLLKNTELNELKNQILEKNNEINDLRLSLKSCDDEVLRLNELIIELHNNLINSNELSQYEINELNQQIRELINERNDIIDERNIYIKTIDNLIKKIQSKNRQIENLSSSSLLKNNEIQILRDDSLSKNNKIQRLSSNSEIKNKKIEELIEDLESKNNEIIILREEYNDCKYKLRYFNNKIEELRIELEKSSLKDQDIKILNNKIKLLLKEKLLIENEKNESMNRINDLILEIYSKNEEVKILRNNSKLKNNEINSLKTRLSDCEEELVNLNSKIEELKIKLENSSLKDQEIQILDDKLKLLLEEKSKNEKQIDEYIKNLIKLEENSIQKNTVIKELLSEKEIKEKIIKDLLDNLNNYKEKINLLKDQFKKLNLKNIVEYLEFVYNLLIKLNLISEKIHKINTKQKLIQILNQITSIDNHKNINEGLLRELQQLENKSHNNQLLEIISKIIENAKVLLNFSQILNFE